MNSAEFMEIRNIQNKFSKSGSFCTFCENHNNSKVVLPNFTTTRWYSAIDLVSSFIQLFPLIVEYSTTIDSTILVTQQQYEWATTMEPVFILIKSAIKILESNEIGTISKVVFIFKTLYMEGKHHLESIFPLEATRYCSLVDFYLDQIISEWGDILFAAAILAPKNCTINSLTDSEHESGLNYIFNIAQQQPYNIITTESSNILKEKSFGYLYLTQLSTRSHPIQNHSSIQSEYDIYKNCLIDDDAPVTEFWRQHKSIFCHLEHVAHEIFSLEPTSTNVERLFSRTKFIYGQYRQKLKPRTSESQALILGNKDLYASRLDKIRNIDL
jgi:hypothetical protein